MGIVHIMRQAPTDLCNVGLIESLIHLGFLTHGPKQEKKQNNQEKEKRENKIPTKISSLGCSSIWVTRLVTLRCFSGPLDNLTYLPFASSPSLSRSIAFSVSKKHYGIAVASFTHEDVEGCYRSPCSEPDLPIARRLS